MYFDVIGSSEMEKRESKQRMGWVGVCDGVTGVEKGKRSKGEREGEERGGESGRKIK